MTCCIEVWTPTRILDCVEDDDGNAVDPFVQAVPDSDYKTFRFRHCGDIIVTPSVIR